MRAIEPLLPARHLGHRPGRYGRGWVLPRGGVITWPARKCDQSEHDRFAETAGFTRAWHSGSLAFEINSSGLLLARAGREPLADQQRARVNAAIVLAYAEKRYEQRGTVYQGALGLEVGHPRLAGLRHEDYRAGLKALVERGELRRRHCRALSFQLPARHRVALIEQRDLHTSWAKRTDSVVAPDDAIYGEIPQAFAQAAAERAERLWGQMYVYHPRNRTQPARSELLWLEVAWQPIDGARRRVRISWGPSPELALEANGEPALHTRTLLTQTPRDTPPLTLAALAEEMEARLRERYANGEALETITRALRSARPSWITQPVAWITD
jgi:hypothetical protein